MKIDIIAANYLMDDHTIMAGVVIRNFEDLIRCWAPEVENFYFVQVGANNPRCGDPLYRFVRDMNWGGILIEPQKWVFEEQLLPAYLDCTGLFFENVAIAEEDGAGELFKLAISRQRWATGIASLSMGHITAHIERGFVEQNIGNRRADLPESKEDYVDVEQIRTMRFDSLLDKYHPAKIDLLQIDAEGHDYRLLQLFDFDRYRPGIVQWESLHMSPDERTNALDHMCGLDYLCFKSSINVVSVQQFVVDRLGLGFADAPLRRPPLTLK